MRNQKLFMTQFVVLNMNYCSCVGGGPKKRLIERGMGKKSRQTRICAAHKFRMRKN